MNENETAIEKLIDSGLMTVKPDGELDLAGSGKYQKLDLSRQVAANFSQVLGQVPGLEIANQTGGWILSFPKGGTESMLTNLHQGGLSTALRGPDGKFVGSASISKTDSLLGMAGFFSVLSMATGQYFMHEIRSEMKLVNEKTDKILDFLYGDKRAEMIAQIYFVQSANANYATLTGSQSQRTAQLIGMQDARKTAMRNILFYQSDLKGFTNPDRIKDAKFYEKACRDSIRIKQSLELSIQLLLQSAWMEVLYTEGCSEGYIESLQSESAWFLESADKCVNEVLNQLVGAGNSFKKENPLDFRKTDCSKSTENVKVALEKNQISQLKCQATDTWKKLKSTVCKPEYYVTTEGVYLRVK